MTAPLEDDFNDIVSKARFGSGLTAADAADRTGLSTDHLAAVETGERAVSRSECDRLAAAYDLDSEALWASARRAYHPDAPKLPGGVEIIDFTFSPMNSRGYLLHNSGSQQTFLVDPGGDAPRILTALAERKWQLSAILLTHGHADHVDALGDVYAHTKAPVYAHPDEWRQKEAFIPLEQPHAPSDEYDIQIGASSIRVIPSPGHTLHSLSFIIHGVVFTGDTLFAGSMGRAFEGPRCYGALLQSGRGLLARSGSTPLLPGHGPMTSVEQERRLNPFLAGNAVD